MRRKNRFHKETKLDEILSYPNGEEILAKYHLPCLGCPFVALEVGTLQIGEVCKMYGIDEKKLLKELNEKIKK